MPVRTTFSTGHYRSNRPLLYCSLLIILCLYVVGFESHGIVRHIVQTAPLWLAVFFARRGSAWTKWVDLPCYVFWLVLIITLISLFLLGWAKVLSGTFTPIEIAMAGVVALSSIFGIVVCLRMKTRMDVIKAGAIFVVTASLQFALLRISFLPAISHDHFR